MDQLDPDVIQSIIHFYSDENFSIPQTANEIGVSTYVVRQVLSARNMLAKRNKPKGKPISREMFDSIHRMKREGTDALETMKYFDIRHADFNHAWGVPSYERYLKERR